MGLDDIVDKAKEAASDAADTAKDLASDAADHAKHIGGDIAGKLDNAVHSEHAEHVTDAVLDATATAAGAVTGHHFDDKVGAVRDSIDEKVGNDTEQAAAAAETGTPAS